MSERQSKNTQDKHENILNNLANAPENKFCADCNAKNPRWASFSLGVFLCIRCAGIHRKIGTHISKIKSITLDQWTKEQIETMRASGGNIQVNKRINPNPNNNPLPLAADDEHAMERYIRAKWEKRAFMNDTSQTYTPPISKAIARLQVTAPQELPKRSSSVPNSLSNNNINEMNFQSQLSQLREMGFKDEIKNKQTLVQTLGKLDTAIKILSRSSSATTMNTAQQSNDTLLSTVDQKVGQLVQLGFMDRSENLEALRRAGGSLEVASAILNDTKSSGSKGLLVTRFSDQVQQQQQPIINSNGNLLIDVGNSNSNISNSGGGNSAPFFNNNNNNIFGASQVQQPQQPQQPHMMEMQANNMFNNPFGLNYNNSTVTAQTINNNPFSQMNQNNATQSFAVNNNVGNGLYSQPTHQNLYQQQQQQQFSTQQQQQQFSTQQQQQQQQSVIMFPQYTNTTVTAQTQPFMTNNNVWLSSSSSSNVNSLF